MAVTGAVGEGVGVGHGALAAVNVCDNGGLAGRERVAAGIGHRRDMRSRGDSGRLTADGSGAVLCAYGEVFRRDMVRVAPGVIRAVDGIVVDEGGVAAAVDERGGVVAGLKRDRFPAVGDARQGGRHDLGETVDIGLAVLSWRESSGGEGVGVGPDGVVTRAVGVAVAENDRARPVGNEGGGAVHEDGRDGSAADVGDDRCGRCRHIHETGHGGAAGGGHPCDLVGHLYGVGVGPFILQIITVRIGIGKDNRTLTISTTLSPYCIGSRNRCLQNISANIFHDGQHRSRRCNSIRNALHISTYSYFTILRWRGNVIDIVSEDPFVFQIGTIPIFVGICFCSYAILLAFLPCCVNCRNRIFYFITTYIHHNWQHLCRRFDGIR